MDGAGEAAPDGVQPGAAPTLPPIVDACALVYDSAAWRLYVDRFRRHAPEYLSVFARSFCHFFGADVEVFRSALAHDWDEAMGVLLPAGRPDLDLEEHLRVQRARGVIGEIVMGSHARRPDGTTVNDWLLDATAAYRDHFSVWAGVELTGRPDAAQQVHRAAAAGAGGLCVIPFLDGTSADDAAHAPLWAAAEEADLPVWLHTGHHFARSQPTGLGSWQRVETLARRHPRLRLVAGHAGWPDVTEMLLTATRHPTVLLEFSSHRARGMPLPGSGWDLALAQAGGIARGRMMFGTSGWVNPVPVNRLAAEVGALPLAPEVLAEWLGGTALELLDRPARQRPS